MKDCIPLIANMCISVSELNDIATLVFTGLVIVSWLVTKIVECIRNKRSMTKNEVHEIIDEINKQEKGDDDNV